MLFSCSCRCRSNSACLLKDNRQWWIVAQTDELMMTSDFRYHYAYLARFFVRSLEMLLVVCQAWDYSAHRLLQPLEPLDWQSLLALLRLALMLLPLQKLCTHEGSLARWNWAPVGCLHWSLHQLGLALDCRPECSCFFLALTHQWFALGKSGWVLLTDVVRN